MKNVFFASGHFSFFVGLQDLFVIFFFRKFDFQNIFWTFFNQIGSIFSRKKGKKVFVATLPYRSRFPNFKMEFRVLTEFRFLWWRFMAKMATDFDETYVSRKLRPSVFKRRKTRQNPIWWGKRLTESRTFCFWNCAILFVLSQYFEKDFFWGGVGYLFILLFWITEIFIYLFFSRVAKCNIVFENYVFFCKKYHPLKKN